METDGSALNKKYKLGRKENSSSFPDALKTKLMVLQWEHSGILPAPVPVTQDVPPKHWIVFGSEDEEEEAEAPAGVGRQDQGYLSSSHLCFAAPMFPLLSLKIHLPKSCYRMFYCPLTRMAKHQASRNYKSRAFFQQPSTEALHKH